eukprot:CAMPEP_0169157606 /NCGR_PEP_ID=MMETSP1015-20121227/54682_1 /TAXON_ID=342587 /ORGANISM="Karlodinium micrum, Strain CCMP2283" /LENGTH=91 /DNA_ID=CAMNT_0009228569 /DNA_START=124 /DNA_END=399 /DNA_ORIENTATION=+
MEASNSSSFFVMAVLSLMYPWYISFGISMGSSNKNPRLLLLNDGSSAPPPKGAKVGGSSGAASNGYQPEVPNPSQEDLADPLPPTALDHHR